MGLFSRNFDRPGPGVSKDEPRKKGMARFIELLFRDMMEFVKLNLLFTLTVLPSAVFFILGALPYLLGYFELNILFLLLSIICAFPIGGSLTACYFNITRLMRDDPSYVWFDFKRKFKENYKQAAPMGIISTAFIYMHILLWVRVYYELVAGTYAESLAWPILALISLLLFAMIFPYIFLHYAYVDMPAFPLLKNSLLMSLAFLPRSFMGALCGVIIWILIALFFPSSMIVLPFVILIFITLSMFMKLSWIWPKFDKNFNIEETLIKRKEEKLAEELDETGDKK